MRKKPTDEQLRRLYAAGVAFKKEKLWQVFHDIELIGVEDPASGVMGYCSITGKENEHFGLVVYLGDRGLAGFSRIVSEDSRLRTDEMLDLQDCLVLSLVDRQDLLRPDWEETRRLGFSFRGKNEWLEFRRYEPGFMPWTLDAGECEFLTLALEQVILAGQEQINQDLDLLEKADQFLFRHLVNGSWQSRTGPIKSQPLVPQAVKFTDELALRRIRKAGCQPQLSYQIDIPLALAPVQERAEQRPHLPRLLLIMDDADNFLVDHVLYNHTEEDLAGLVFDRLKYLHANDALPCRILCKSLELYAVLLDFCRKTDIKLVLADELPAVDLFMTGLDEFSQDAHE